MLEQLGLLKGQSVVPGSTLLFLDATEGSALVAYLGRLTRTQPPSEAVERKLIGSVRRYFFVGGMPEAVRAYVERKDLMEVQRIQTALVETVQADFAKYGPGRGHGLMQKTY